MAKITTREQLIAYAEEHLPDGYNPNSYSIVCLHDDSGSKVLEPRFHGYPESLINNDLAHLFQLSPFTDFHDLPTDFFVDTYRVRRDYADKVDDAVTRKALMDTCITRENFWVFRETLRLVIGEHKPATFTKTLNNLGVLKPALALHFPHVSKTDPTMVAYTPSLAYGKADRQVITKIGKYLTKYYSDCLKPEDIRAFANGAKNFEVKWATDEESMRYVYKYGPSSCMSGDAGDFERLYGDYHPVDVYATGEFRLAYIEPVTQRIIARGFVHEPTKTWVRVYGDEADSLADYLNDNGYTKADSWEGCRIKRIRDNNDNLVLPYLDGSDKGVMHSAGGMFTITGSRSKSDYWCDFTDGTPEQEETNTCDNCHSEHNEDDLTYSEYHGHTICPDCIDNYTYALTGHSRWDYVHNDRVVLNSATDEYYEQNFADRAGLVETHTGDCYPADDCVQNTDDEWIHEDDAIVVGVDSSNAPIYNCDCRIHRDYVVQFVPGTSTPVALWDPDCMSAEIRARYEADPQVMDDFGTQYGLEFRAMTSLMLIHPVNYLRDMLAPIEYYPDPYAMQNWLNRHNYY